MSDKSKITDAVLDRISEKFGSSETLHSIKFGRGAVGKIAVISAFCFVALGGTSFRLDANGAMLAVGVIGVVFLCAVGAVVLIIHKQPELAVLEGMELVRYKQVTIGAKGYTPETLTLPVPDPKPALTDGDDGDQK